MSVKLVLFRVCKGWFSPMSVKPCSVPALSVQVLGPGDDVVAVVAVSGTSVNTRPGCHSAHALVVCGHATWGLTGEGQGR
ncbi:hypothetical protein ElyMa_001323000 [Elysia marginata]|uniref:Uncharacterized protein n=1 Tax=Elysia marginata TaxID=1093978 RepID=A0AAV4IMB8_9GAST|nr:hypothetical protein ElyMa_001323000 [Elysia marginata]